MMKHDSAMMSHDSMMMPGAMSHAGMDAEMMSHEDMMAPHGSFSGAHGHQVSGGYHIVNGGKALQLSDDFVLDQAPDPYVVLSGSEKGSGAKTLNLGLLTSRKGASVFAIPAGTDLTRYHHVLIWCKRYDVTLGRADLAAGGAMMHH